MSRVRRDRRNFNESLDLHSQGRENPGTRVALLVVVPDGRQDLVSRALVLTSSILAICRRVRQTSPMHEDLARQLFRSASSIGANLEEGKVVNGRRDMAAKFAIAFRESRETAYWLRLLEMDEAWRNDVNELLQEANEFVAMLTTSVRKLRS